MSIDNITYAEKMVHRFLECLAQRDLKNLISLFADDVDWYIPGDEEMAPWLGRRKSRQEVAAFYEMLWENTEPVSADIEDIYIKEDKAVIAGEFSTRMKGTGKTVSSMFFIRLKIKNQKIVTYRLLEDSYAVSNSLKP